MLSVLFLSGCADLFLEAARWEGPLKDKDLSSYQQMRDIAGCQLNTEQCSIDDAIELAFNQADAYATAARNTQTAQDLLSLGLLRAAGLVATGSLAGVEDVALAERAIEAVAVQQVGARYTPRSAVQSLYTGASRMNCIAMAGNLHQEVNLNDISDLNPTTDVPIKLASFTMVLAMREVEYRTLYGISRNLDDFSTLLTAFEAAGKRAVDTEVIVEETVEESEQDNEGAQTFDTETKGQAQQGARQTRTVTVIQRNPALERFFNVVGSCLENAAIQPKTESNGEGDG